jgi:hypothetical protein
MTLAQELWLICFAEFSVIVISIVGMMWWWIKMKIRLRFLRKVAASLNRRAEMLENFIQNLHALADETERVAVPCRQPET